MLPFAHLNLRHNPFGAVEFAERGGLAVADVDRHVRRLREPDYAVQFLGDRGRGKTTHLLAVGRHFPQAPYLHVAEGQRPRLPEGPLLLIDEIQWLPPERRRQLMARPIALAIGSHEDVEHELRAAGFEVDTVEVARQLDCRRLLQIFARRIEAARRAPGALPRLRPATVRRLMTRHADNVRAMEGELYEVFQRLDRICDV